MVIRIDLTLIKQVEVILFKDLNNKEMNIKKIKIKVDLILEIEYLYDK